MADQIIHAFEKAGLGVAPFRLVGVEIKKFQACQGAPVQPGGCCAYCGTGIMECCIIRDRNGKTFEVGNVCVGKTGDAGLINETKRKLNAVKKQARWESESMRIREASERLSKDQSLRDKLATLPHPYSPEAFDEAGCGEEYFRGMTRLDWANWMMSKAGNAGMMQVVRFVDKLQKQKAA